MPGVIRPFMTCQAARAATSTVPAPASIPGASVSERVRTPMSCCASSRRFSAATPRAMIPSSLPEALIDSIWPSELDMTAPASTDSRTTRAASSCERFIAQRSVKAVAMPIARAKVPAATSTMRSATAPARAVSTPVAAVSVMALMPWLSWSASTARWTSDEAPRWAWKAAGRRRSRCTICALSRTDAFVASRTDSEPCNHMTMPCTTTAIAMPITATVAVSPAPPASSLPYRRTS